MTIMKAAVTLSLAGFLAAPAAAQTVLKFSHYADLTHPGHAAAQQFVKGVEARTSGKLKIELYSGNQLGAPPEQLQQVKLGSIDMGVPTQGQLDKFEKAFAAVMMPFVFDDLAHAHRVLDGPAMAWMAPLAEKQGFVILANWEWGFRNLTTGNRPVAKPDDVKGLKVRVPPEIQLEATFEALGAQVTKIAFPELYMALSQRVVDAQENPVATILALKAYEVQKHLALTRHSYNNWIHVINARKWQSLSPEHQSVLREESQKAGAFMRKTLADSEANQIKDLEKRGMIVARIDTKPFRDRMDPAYKKIAGYAGEANVKKFLELVEQGRKK